MSVVTKVINATDIFVSVFPMMVQWTDTWRSCVKMGYY
jgi:hypothetical protein